MKKRTKALIIVLSAIGVVGLAAAILVPLSIKTINHPNAPKVNESKKHIACIGDSVTFGNGVFPFQNSLSYPAYLGKLVKPDYQVLNYGLSGRTLMDEGDHPYTKEKFFEVSHDVNADIYTIMLGSNDSKSYNWQYAGENGEKFKEELIEFAKSYINLENSPKVYLMQPPKAHKQAFHIDNDIIKNDIYRIYKEVSEELHTGLIDIYSLTESHSEWFMDGVHPNKQGDQAIAEYIYSVIKEE